MTPPRCSAGRPLLVTLILTVGISFGATAGADTMPVRLEFDSRALVLAERGGFVSVELPGCELLPRIGAPALPCRAERIILPPGSVARGVEAVSASSIRIPCGLVRPAEPPAILGRPGQPTAAPEPVTPDPAIYEGSALYPTPLAVFRGTGHLLDRRVAACEVHPVQYDPVARELILHTEIELTLELADDPGRRRLAPGPTSEMSRIAGKLLAGTGGSDPVPERLGPGSASSLDPEAYQYVIVTSAAQAGAYETYAAWKTQKGVPATVVTVEEIDSGYPGRDLPEKIRNFIIEAVNQWGTSYVLLGGDQPVVPSRIAWAFDCEAGLAPDENDLHADLYYSDLDGDWDADMDGIFGEVSDEVDLYPDVLVGRAPTNTIAEAVGVVAKFMTYERTPPLPNPGAPPPFDRYATRAFLFAEILWWNPYTDAGIGKDMIADQHFGPDFEPIERQYESLGNLTPTAVRYSLDDGPHLTNHGGHAWHNVMGCGPGMLRNTDVSGLTNGPRYFVLYSIGCWAGAFDYDSIGERFLTNPNGGAVAVVANSRYGWGSPGNPGWGYSETFDRDFYGALLSEGLPQFGAAVAWSKVLRIPYSQDENVYRWHLYQVNLFGDPEMACHTAEAQILALEAPATVPLGSPAFTVTVTDDDGPVAGARLCLMGADVYEMGFTDQGGQVAFAPALPSAETLTLTATAANHQYAEVAIIAAGNDPFLTIDSRSIDDDAVPPSAGNGDGEIGAGETIELFVTVMNHGGQDATQVTGTLSTGSSQVTLVEGVASYGTVAAGGQATNATPFVLTVDPGCPPDETILFGLLLEDQGAGSWSSGLPLTVVRPGPRVHHYAFRELTGNGNGLIDPGETIELVVTVVNEGSGDVSPLTAALTTTDPDVTVLQGFASTTSTLGPGESAVLSPPYEIEVGAACPETGYCALDLAFTHDEGSDLDDFLLAIGEPGFADDMESGQGGWTHAGTQDYWHLTDYKQHSGTTSWYCGTQDHRYLNGMNATLTSPAFVAPDRAQLAFWCTFSVTTYGVDGLYIEIDQDGQWETLDFIGSGGALDSTLFSCDWSERVYPLDGLDPGATTQVRFRFTSDATDTDEGFYVDDVAIRSASSTSVDFPLELTPLALADVSPNPTNGPASWRLHLPVAAQVTARLYNSRGAQIHEIAAGPMTAGDHELSWDGRTDRGRPAPPGVYFLRLTVGNRDQVRKVVRMQR